MIADLSAISKLDIPYTNLVISGMVSVGKTAVGRHIADTIGLDFFDVDDEIETHEVMSISAIRETYGDSRLKSLEYEMCRHASLMRRAVIAISGGALLDDRNLKILAKPNTLVLLTCQLGVTLRRMHVASEQHYRDRTIRRRMMSRLRRETTIVNNPTLTQLDTSNLNIDETARILLHTWLNEDDTSHPAYRTGPAPKREVKSPRPADVSKEWKDRQTVSKRPR